MNNFYRVFLLVFFLIFLYVGFISGCLKPLSERLGPLNRDQVWGQITSLELPPLKDGTRFEFQESEIRAFSQHLGKVSVFDFNLDEINKNNVSYREDIRVAFRDGRKATVYFSTTSTEASGAILELAIADGGFQGVQGFDTLISSFLTPEREAELFEFLKKLD